MLDPPARPRGEAARVAHALAGEDHRLDLHCARPARRGAAALMRVSHDVRPGILRRSPL
ncbi:hypothetical protein BLAT2472_40481 [Burkholderia latens]